MLELTDKIGAFVTYRDYKRYLRDLYEKFHRWEEITDEDKFYFYQTRAFIFHYRSLFCINRSLKKRLAHRDSVSLSEMAYYDSRINRIKKKRER